MDIFRINFPRIASKNRRTEKGKREEDKMVVASKRTNEHK
jgi:hypothetical protein